MSDPLLHSKKGRVRQRISMMQARAIMGLAMAILYLTTGAVLLLPISGVPKFPEPGKSILAGLLLTYGAFRLYRALVVLKDFSKRT